MARKQQCLYSNVLEQSFSGLWSFFVRFYDVRWIKSYTFVTIFSQNFERIQIKCCPVTNMQMMSCINIHFRCSESELCVTFSKYILTIYHHIKWRRGSGGWKRTFKDKIRNNMKFK